MLGLEHNSLPRGQLAITVLWPAFIVALPATGLFFAAFDPRELTPFDLDIEISQVTAYSIGFFLFWILAILSSYGTLYFTLSNRHLIRKQGK